MRLEAEKVLLIQENKEQSKNHSNHSNHGNPYNLRINK